MTNARRGALRTAATAGLVFVGSFALFVVLLQRQPYGDGITYLDYLSEGHLVAHHLLYLPAMRLFSDAAGWFGVPLRSAAFAFSAFAAAIGNALLYLLLATSRALLPTPSARPLLITALVATSPSLFFFATQLENHAHHYAWVVLTLFVVDRALARDSWLLWGLAGIALLGAFTSHSSVALLCPALLVTIHVLRAGRLWRLPAAREAAALAILFGPLLVFKLLEGRIRVDLLGSDAAFRHDTSLEFMLSLLAWRSVGTWLDYLAKELFLPAWGLLWSLAILAVQTRRGHRSPLWLLGLAFLPYVLVFGHWNVREHGAYYTACLPACGLVLARLLRDARRDLTIVLTLVLLGQLAFSTWSVATYVDRIEATGTPAWEYARDAAAVAPDGTVLCWSGVVALHLKQDAGIEAQPMENWYLVLKQQARANPDIFQRLAFQEPLPRLIKLWLAKPGPLVLSGRLVERLRHIQDLGPVLRKFTRDYRLVQVTHGEFHGLRVERKP